MKHWMKTAWLIGSLVVPAYGVGGESVSLPLLNSYSKNANTDYSDVLLQNLNSKFQSRFPELGNRHWQKLSQKVREQITDATESEIAEWLIVLEHPVKDDYSQFTSSAYATAARRRATSAEALADVKRELTSRWRNIEVQREFKHLPVLKVRLSEEHLAELLQSDVVLAVMEEQYFDLQLSQSLAVINQPQATVTGLTGEGIGVAVVDSGVDYTKSTFHCSAPGVPSSCAVVRTVEIAEQDGQLDAQGHGTNVAGVLTKVAPGAKLVVLDVMGNNGQASSTDLNQAIDWIIDNQDAYNIRVANFSLGGNFYSSPCNSWWSNPLYTAMTSLVNNNILPVAAAGNGASGSSLASPACMSAVLSVGATYDAAYSSVNYPDACTDANVVVDDIACYSNSASFLDMLAPGSIISVGGQTAVGTSIAAPHVTGAAAIIAERFAFTSQNQLRFKLMQSTAWINDSRNGYSFQRLSLEDSLVPENDNFADAQTVNIAQVISDNSAFAGTEAGEGSVGASVWYRFNVTVSGYYVVDLVSALALDATFYTGPAINQLTPVGSATAGQSTGIQLSAGVQYSLQIFSSDSGGEFNLTFSPGTPPTENLDEDIPFMPLWALLLMAGGFFSVVGKKRY